MAKKVAQYGKTSIVGGIAFKAFDNQKSNKALSQTEAIEHKRLFDTIEKLNLTPEDKVVVFTLMVRVVSVQEIADSVSLDEHKAEVYISAYLAIEVDDQQERTFLNNLSIAICQKVFLLILSNRPIQVLQHNYGYNLNGPA